MAVHALCRLCAMKLPVLSGVRRAAPSAIETSAATSPKASIFTADLNRVLRMLDRDGCPICAESTGHDGPYFFWFFNENYFEPHTVAALTQSLGFCRTHGEILARAMVGGSQLRYVHERLTEHVHDVLAEQPPDRPGGGKPQLAVSGPCPACRSRLESERRNIFWLGQVLRHPEGIERYGRPGMLCYPHLQLITPVIPDPVFLRLLSLHQAAMRTLSAGLRTGDDNAQQTTAATSDERRRALYHVLALCVGHDANREPYPSLKEYDRPAGTRDPVRSFLDSLRGNTCPICLEIRRAWLEWAAWLDTAADLRERAADLLPTCPKHVWPLIHEGSPRLAFAITQHVLEGRLGELVIAAPRPPVPPRTFWERINERLWGPRRRIQAARDVVARGVHCPVCERLAIAEERAVALLVALLEDRQGRMAFENAYGLCLKHFVRAVSRTPSLEVRRLLVNVERGRLATLHWELVEAGRKAAWQFRPETKGMEETAWRRALLRFAGSLRPHAT